MLDLNTALVTALAAGKYGFNAGMLTGFIAGILFMLVLIVWFIMYYE